MKFWYTIFDNDVAQAIHKITAIHKFAIDCGIMGMPHNYMRILGLLSKSFRFCVYLCCKFSARILPSRYLGWSLKESLVQIWESANQPPVEY